MGFAFKGHQFGTSFGHQYPNEAADGLSCWYCGARWENIKRVKTACRGRTNVFARDEDNFGVLR
jgi:hypothetical protein